jgi:hypothetical protein
MDTRLPWDRRKACGCLKVNGARSFAASALMLAGLACGPSNPPAPLYGVPIDQITSDLPKYIGVTAVIYGYLHSSVTLHPAADVEGRRPGLSFADVDIRESLFTSSCLGSEVVVFATLREYDDGRARAVLLFDVTRVSSVDGVDCLAAVKR